MARDDTPGTCGRLSKICVITGTRGSLGRVTAKVFARESASVVGCNVAGTAHFNWLEDNTDEDWDRNRCGEVDLFCLTRAAWPHLKASRCVVVNMASLNPSLSSKILPSLAHTSSKAGTIAMTRQLAMEGSEHRIGVDSISPGLIESNAAPAQVKDPEWVTDVLGKTLLARLGRPDDVAKVALFLASDESSCVTGIDVVVHGGTKVW